MINLNRYGSTLPRIIKNRIMPKGIKVRKIPFGLLCGIMFETDLNAELGVYLGLWERETYAWVKKLSKDIKTAIDVGAASGEHVLFFLCKTTVDKVYVFEPTLKLCENINKNLALNGFAKSPKVEIFSKFIGLKNTGNEMNLDSLLSKIKTPCFIKIDIDGGELLALKGAEKLLQNPGIRLLVEVHSKELEKDCKQLLSSFGYETKIIYNAWWRLFIPEPKMIETNRWLIAYKQL